MNRRFKDILNEVSNLPNRANVFKNIGAVYDPEDGYIDFRTVKAPSLGYASTIKKAPLYYKSFADFRKADEKDKQKDYLTVKKDQATSMLSKSKSENDPFAVVTNGKTKFIITKSELQSYLNKGYKKV